MSTTERRHTMMNEADNAEVVGRAEIVKSGEIKNEAGELIGGYNDILMYFDLDSLGFTDSDDVTPTD